MSAAKSISPRDSGNPGSGARTQQSRNPSTMSTPPPRFAAKFIFKPYSCKPFGPCRSSLVYRKPRYFYILKRIRRTRGHWARGAQLITAVVVVRHEAKCARLTLGPGELRKASSMTVRCGGQLWNANLRCGSLIALPMLDCRTP